MNKKHQFFSWTKPNPTHYKMKNSDPNPTEPQPMSISAVVFYGTYRIYPWMLSAPFGVRGLGVFAISLIILIVHYCHWCAEYCRLPAGVLRVAYTVIVRSLVLLHDTAFILGECFLPLAAIPCSVV